MPAEKPIRRASWVVITGRYPVGRNNIKAALTSLGITVKPSVNRNTDILFAADLEASTTKKRTAEIVGCEIRIGPNALANSMLETWIRQRRGQSGFNFNAWHQWAQSHGVLSLYHQPNVQLRFNGEPVTEDGVRGVSVVGEMLATRLEREDRLRARAEQDRKRKEDLARRFEEDKARRELVRIEAEARAVEAARVAVAEAEAIDADELFG
jgi:hypothetical protein